MATINVTAGEIQNVVSISDQPIQTIAVNIGNNTSALPAAVPVINTAIADDFASIAPTAQQSPLSAPDNFVFVDNMVGVDGTIPGDKFQGTTQGITSQFIFLTPDSIG